MKAEARFHRIVNGADRGPLATVARAGLSALSPLYGAAARARNWSFDHGWRRAQTLPRPVISVGNLTVGGTGKTPVVAWLCQSLGDRGIRPAVLLRGYKAAPGQKGDEQRLLEGLLGPATPVEADPDRSTAAQRVLARSPDVQVFVLDDAFQHRRVRREVDLVLVDATQPFGHGRLLPRGLLREPISSLRRATAVLITRAEPGDAGLTSLRERIAQHTDAPVFESRFVADDIRDATGRPIESIAGRTVLAVCGIGNPPAFIRTLEQQGAALADTAIFADHHAYTPADVRQIVESAGRRHAVVATTAKDWVKLEPLWPRDATAGVAILNQRIAFKGDDGDRLLALALQTIQATPPRDAA